MDSLVYVNVLEDSLSKKISLLNSILELTKEQETLLKAESFDEEAFRAVLEKKQVYIDKLEELDNGFESIFERVKEELKDKKEQYKSNILRLQKQISVITELGVDIEALERRNKSALERVLSEEKNKIKGNRLGNQGAVSYYNQMVNMYGNQSSFMDKKK